MKFFFDQNISPQIPAGMREFGEDAIHLTEEFSADTPDLDWIPVIGERGWILITRDGRIRKNELEKAALRDHNVKAFIFTGKNLRRCDVIQQIVRLWPRLKEIAASQDPPFAYSMRSSGTRLDRLSL